MKNLNDRNDRNDRNDGAFARLQREAREARVARVARVAPQIPPVSDVDARLAALRNQTADAASGVFAELQDRTAKIGDMDLSSKLTRLPSASIFNTRVGERAGGVTHAADGSLYGSFGGGKTKKRKSKKRKTKRHKSKTRRRRR